jgi:hypothetical protein
MLAWMLTDITAGRTGHNIGMMFVQSLCGFLQSRTVPAVG